MAARAGRFLRGIHVKKGEPKVAISDAMVAVIGTGNIGSRLAANFAAGGQDFLLAGRAIWSPS